MEAGLEGEGVGRVGEGWLAGWLGWGLILGCGVGVVVGCRLEGGDGSAGWFGGSVVSKMGEWEDGRLDWPEVECGDWELRC
jgi:hypothetical protein